MQNKTHPQTFKTDNWFTLLFMTYIIQMVSAITFSTLIELGEAYQALAIFVLIAGYFLAIAYYIKYSPRDNKRLARLTLLACLILAWVAITYHTATAHSGLFIEQIESYTLIVALTTILTFSIFEGITTFTTKMLKH